MEFLGKSWRPPGIFIITNVLFVFVISKLLRLKARTRYLLLLVQYLILSETLFVLLTKGVYKRVVKKWPSSTSWCGVGLRLFLGIVILLSQCFALLHFFLAGTEPNIMAFVVGYAFGFVMYLLLAVFLVEIVFAVRHFIISKKRSSAHKFLSPAQENHKEDLTYLVSVLALTFLCFYMAAKQGHTFPQIRYVTVPIRNLPRSFNNTVIVQLSDLHIGVVNGKKALSKVVSISNGLKPDIVAITGDTAEGSVNRIRNALKPLKNLRAKYGVYITTGKLFA